MKKSQENIPTVLEQEAPVSASRRTFSIGLPLCHDTSEKRFPITPEAAQQLTDEGFTVRLEAGAGASIHYTDEQYSRCGAEICSRGDALACDIVLHLAPLSVRDIQSMRRGAMLLSLFSLSRQTPESVRALLKRGIVAVALDLVEDSAGNTPFADILAEIDGRAAIARASSLLADADHGKGILLGGVAGVMPCEVTIIGSGLAARAAARSAMGLGALVRMLDYDVYRLRSASRDLGEAVVASSLHPRALGAALRTADVVVNTPVRTALSIDIDTIASMKRGAMIFDLSDGAGKAFPSLPAVDLTLSSPIDIAPGKNSRVCYINAGSLVPRTAAMALSDTFITMMREIVTCEGLTNALKLLPGLQRAAYTFMGKAVNPDIAALAGMRPMDINIYLTLS